MSEQSQSPEVDTNNAIFAGAAEAFLSTLDEAEGLPLVLRELLVMKMCQDLAQRGIPFEGFITAIQTARPGIVFTTRNGTKVFNPGKMFNIGDADLDSAAPDHPIWAEVARVDPSYGPQPSPLN